MKEEVKIFITFFIIFSYFAFWASWNEESSYSLVKSIIEENRFEIDSYKDNTGDRIYCNNHYYSDKYPGLSFLSAPVYSVINKIASYSHLNEGSELYYFSNEIKLNYDINFQQNDLSRLALTVCTSSLFSALTVLLFYKFLKYQKNSIRNYRLIIIFSLGIGSLLMPHALVFTRHATETFLFFLSLMLIILNKNNDYKRIFISGCVYGFGISMSPTLFILTIPYFLYISKKIKKNTRYFILGLLLGVLPLFLYSLFIGMTPFLPTFINTILSNYLNTVCLNQENAHYITQTNINNVLERPIFTIPQLLFYPSKGLFFYYPLMFLLLIEMLKSKRNRYEKMLFSTSFLILLIFVSIMPLWWGGWSGYGPRYFLPMVPLLYLWSAGMFSRFNWKIWIIPLVLSIFTTILLLQYGEDIINELNPNRYMEKLKTLQPLSNPLLEHYFPLFLKNGPRSMLFESLIIDKKIDIRLSAHSCGLNSPVIKKDEIFLFTLPNGILTLRIPFLALTPLVLILSFIWRNEISKKFKLDNKRVSIIVLVFLIIFTLFFLRVRNWLYTENWYPIDTFDGKVYSDTRWMSQNATLILFNKNNETKRVNLLFEVESFHKPRNLFIFLNDKQVGVYEIDDNKTINQKIELIPKTNELKFHSVEDCNRPTELGFADCELRCLSFGFSNLEIRNLR